MPSTNNVKLIATNFISGMDVGSVNRTENSQIVQQIDAAIAAYGSVNGEMALSPSAAQDIQRWQKIFNIDPRSINDGVNLMDDTQDNHAFRLTMGGPGSQIILSLEDLVHNVGQEFNLNEEQKSDLTNLLQPHAHYDFRDGDKGFGGKDQKAALDIVHSYLYPNGNDTTDAYASMYAAYLLQNNTIYNGVKPFYGVGSLEQVTADLGAAGSRGLIVASIVEASGGLDKTPVVTAPDNSTASSNGIVVNEAEGDRVLNEVVTDTVVLGKGSIDKSVEELQNRFNALGLRDKDGNALKADGRYGNNTGFAAGTLQESFGVARDNKVGEITVALTELAEVEKALAETNNDNLSEIVKVRVDGDIVNKTRGEYLMMQWEQALTALEVAPLETVRDPNTLSAKLAKAAGTLEALTDGSEIMSQVANDDERLQKQLLRLNNPGMAP